MVVQFRKLSVGAVVLLLLLSLVVHFNFFIKPPLVVVGNSDGLISIFLEKYIKPLPSAILVLLYHLFILAQAIYLNTALNNLKMYQQQNFTTAMSYVLFTGFFVQWHSIAPPLIANVFVILIFTQLAKLYNHPSPKSLIFNTGVLSAITIILYHPTSILICISIFALAIVRPFRIAEWLLLLMGVLLPFYFLASILFLANKFKFLKFYLPGIQLHIPTINATLFFWIGFAIFMLSLLLGLYAYAKTSNRMILQLRKNWSVMLLLLLLILPIPFIYENATLEVALISLVPIATFTGCFYLYPRKLLMPNLLFWISILLVITINFLLIKN